MHKKIRLACMTAFPLPISGCQCLSAEDPVRGYFVPAVAKAGGVTQRMLNKLPPSPAKATKY